MEPGDTVGAHVPVHVVDGHHESVITDHPGGGFAKTRPTKPTRGRCRLWLWVRVLMALAAMAGSASATTIVILVTPARIVIAADSKQTGTRFQKAVGILFPSRAPDTLTCKIQVRGHSAFIASGTVRGGSSGRSFDVYASATPLLESDEAVIRKYADLFRAISTFNLPSFQVEPLKAGFVTWEDGRPQYILGTFEQRTCSYNPNADQVRTGISAFEWIGRSVLVTREAFDQSWLSVCSDRRCEFAEVLGVESAVDRNALKTFLSRHPSEKDMAAMAEEVVRQQIAASPELVGGPIDVAVIDRKGARWIRQKPECQQPAKQQP